MFQAWDGKVNIVDIVESGVKHHNHNTVKVDWLIDV